MALVNYSDSEASDSEQENVTQPQQKKTVPAPTPAPANNPPKQPSGANFSSIVDRSNPRKIRVALPEIKPETADGDQEGEDGPARKKPRLGGGGGGGGGAFSGFNAMLPAPKRKTVTADKDKKPAGPARKVFGLKTGAAPGFDRSADAEMRHNQALEGDDEDIPKAGSLQAEDHVEAGGASEIKPPQKPEGEVKLKGNAMMFKPLSVGRSQKKKPPKAGTPLPAADESKPVPQPKQPQQPPTQQAPPPPAPKPKVSLFSISSEDSSATAPSNGPAQSTSYQPLVYNTTPDAPLAGPALESEATTASAASTAALQQTQTLDNIADDLNLSRAQRRHLFGRHGDTSKSRILNFNTDTEYAANQEMAQGTDLAAAQHNPVRAIAPGKHTLQQLVNAASNQRDALEESFATGRRNKKEAGSKYGW